MNFGDFETRPRISDAIPKDAIDHAFNMADQTRRTENAAAWKIAETGAQQPQEAADMINMGMADENVADLMGYPAGESARITQVKQQASLLLVQSQMQQRVAKDAIDQNSVQTAQFGCRSWPSTVISSRKGHGVGRWNKLQIA